MALSHHWSLSQYRVVLEEAEHLRYVALAANSLRRLLDRPAVDLAEDVSRHLGFGGRVVVVSLGSVVGDLTREPDHRSDKRDVWFAVERKLALAGCLDRAVNVDGFGEIYFNSIVSEVLRPCSKHSIGRLVFKPKLKEPTKMDEATTGLRTHRGAIITSQPVSS